MVGAKPIALGLIFITITANSAFADERVITRDRRDYEGNVTHVCGAPGTWGRVSYLDAIRDIEAGTHTYVVEIPGYPRVDVFVSGPPTRPFLKTVSDEYAENNLDNLPDC